MKEYKLIATNSLGESIDLWNNNEVFITDISGVSLAADVNTAALGSLDGSAFINSRLPERDITLTIRYKVGNAESAKLRLYRIFRAKTELMLRYVSPQQDKYIVGHVSKCDSPPTGFPMVTQIVIRCENPYWKEYGGQRIQLFGVSSMFEFIEDATELNEVEFGNTKTNTITTIEYGGDVDTGVTFVFKLKESAKVLGAVNIDTKEQITVEADFLAGDTLKICTVSRQKAVTLTRDGVETDLFSNLVEGSVFLQLAPGENKFKVLADGTDGTDYINSDIYCDFETLSGGV